MQDQEELELKLAEYKAEHKSLDSAISELLTGNGPINLVQVQTLKKKKLWLKDMIQKIESSLIDDIIA
jgi:hypothetical protein